MEWLSSDIAAEAAKDFDSAWMQSIKLVPSGGYQPKKRGRPHIEGELIKQLRSAFLEAGYDETMLPSLVGQESLSDAFGPEEGLASSDTFALTALPRPRRELGASELGPIKKIAPTFNMERLAILSGLIEAYSKEEFNSQRLLSLMVERAGIRMEQAVKISNLLFGSQQKGVPTHLFLRHGISYSWFPTLAALSKKQPLPLQLFSIGPSFRRGEMKESSFASGAIMAENVSNGDGKESLSRLFKPIGITPNFEKSPATSKIFIPGTEEAISASGLRLGRMGLASPIALSAHGLEFPTLIFEFSIERLAVALGLGHSDKEVRYPQFFGEWEMADSEIADLIRIGQKPSGWGKEISNKIAKTCLLYSSQPAPCEFRVFEKEVGEHKLEVWLVSDAGTLCGKDFNNEVYVYNGNILSTPAMPDTALGKNAVSKGIRTGITLVSAFSDYAAALIEASPTKPREIAVKQAGDASEANIVVPKLVRDYVKSKGTALSVGGELGLKVVSRVKRLWRHEQPR